VMFKTLICIHTVKRDEFGTNFFFPYETVHMDGRQFHFNCFQCSPCTASGDYYDTQSVISCNIVCILWWLLDGKYVYFYVNNKLSTSTTTVNLLHLSAVYASDLHSCNKSNLNATQHC
jgi:hypothetical protein